MSDAYRERLKLYAESFCLAQNDLVAGDLAAGTPGLMVDMFTDGNLEKRHGKIKDQLEFVGEFFDADEFDGYIKTYITTVHLAAYDTGCSDGDRFLVWLKDRANLSEEQRDAIRCQRARHEIESIARLNRLAHIRFQERLTVADRLAEELGENDNLRVVVNPIAVRTSFRSHALIDEDAELPALVQFYPYASDIRTALLEDDGFELIERLSEAGASTLDELGDLMLFKVSQEELIDLLRDLLEMGLVALV